MKTVATVIETPKRSHYLVGVSARCATEVNNTIPHRVITMDNNDGKITVIENPKGEYLSFGPGEGNDEISSKTINLVGVSFPKEVFLNVCVVPYESIEPTYIKR